MDDNKTELLTELTKKLNRYLRQESTVYFKMEKMYKTNPLDKRPELYSEAKFLDDQITSLQNEIKSLKKELEV
ncbi:MAG: hypothetical protein IKR19_08750 [Acholeplasmatales bacterium]|nr:hypothetical protein [Acholeplasmatales bacterium]